MPQKTSSSVLMVSLLAGLAGAALALLFAPRSGRETRQQIREKAEGMKQRTQKGLHSVKENVDHKIVDAKDLKNRLTAAVSNTGRKAKEEMEELKDETERKRQQQSPVLTSWEEEV